MEGGGECSASEKAMRGEILLILGETHILVPLSVPNALPDLRARNVTYQQEQHPAAPRTSKGML